MAHKFTPLALLLVAGLPAFAQEVLEAPTPGEIAPTIQAEDLAAHENEPHVLLIQDPLLGATATVSGLKGSACFNAAYDLANYADKETACLNADTGYLSLSYDF